MRNTIFDKLIKDITVLSSAENGYIYYSSSYFKDRYLLSIEGSKEDGWDKFHKEILRDGEVVDLTLDQHKVLDAIYWLEVERIEDFNSRKRLDKERAEVDYYKYGHAGAIYGKFY